MNTELPPAPRWHRWKVTSDYPLVFVWLQRRTLRGWKTVDCTIGHAWEPRSALAAGLLRRHEYRGRR